MTTPIVSTETRWGRLEVLKQDVYIGWSMIAYGEYSPAEWRLLVSLIQPNDWVVDVGCNVGALAAPLIAAGAFVIGFEAQPVLADLADRNCREAGRRPGAGVGYVSHAACGASTGTIAMPQPDYANAGNFGGVGAGQGEYQVPLRLLDDQLAGAGPIRLIKVDVEGMELDVLAGAQWTIARDRPVLYLEADRPEKVTPLLDWLVSYGYRWHWHRPPLFSADNFRQFVYCLPHLDGVVSSNVVAIPSERPVASWESDVVMGRV